MHNVSSLKHLDLFSGIGGFSLGLEATGGFETVAFCDIEKFPRKILKKHWPHVKQYKDIKELTYERLQTDGIIPIDIITGGYPCQPFSVAGRKKGEKDKRHLWPEMFRLIRECKPTWVIGENVSGHIKQGLDTVLENLESEGYSTRAFSISASSIGATHKRERIWIVAYSERNDNQQKVEGVNGKEKEISKEDRQNNGDPRKSSGASDIWKTNNEYVANTTTHGSFDEQKRNINSMEEAGEREKETGNQSSVRTSSCSSNTADKNVGNTISRNAQTRCGEQSISFEKSREEKTTWSSRTSTFGIENLWETEPDVGRVAHGVPDRVDRLKGLGNSLVPAIPYIIGQSILRE